LFNLSLSPSPFFTHAKASLYVCGITLFHPVFSDFGHVSFDGLKPPRPSAQCSSTSVPGRVISIVHYGNRNKCQSLSPQQQSSTLLGSKWGMLQYYLSGIKPVETWTILDTPNTHGLPNYYFISGLAQSESAVITSHWQAVCAQKAPGNNWYSLVHKSSHDTHSFSDKSIEISSRWRCGRRIFRPWGIEKFTRKWREQVKWRGQFSGTESSHRGRV
jgi:hypothetical protein